MIRTLPNGQTEFAAVTGESYQRARDVMAAAIDAMRGSGVEAPDFANACLAFLAASMAAGKLSAGAVAASLGELAHRAGDSVATRRVCAAFTLAAGADAELTADGIATLSTAIKDPRFDASCWSTLTTIADDLAHRRCRGVVPCPSCQAERCRGHIADASASAAAKSN